MLLFKNILQQDKGKAIRLHAWTGPERSKMLRLPHFWAFRP
jgi:hypothetical protein